MALTLTKTDMEWGFFTRTMAQVYAGCSRYVLPGRWQGLPETVRPMLDVVYKVHGGEYEIQDPVPVERVGNGATGKRLVVGFSGGKDSLAALLEARAQGYDVTAFHVAGINRGAPDERQYAARMARRCGLPMVVRTVKLAGKLEYPENYVKNQFIVAAMVQWGAPQGIANYSLGNALSRTVATCHPRYTLTDTVELLKAMQPFFEASYPAYRYHWFLDNGTDSYRILVKYAPNSIPFVKGCLALPWQKKIWREANERKYGLRLLPNRCGSCGKCCLEYVILYDMGYLDAAQGRGNAGFRKHCIDYLRRVAPRETPHAKNPDKLTDEQIVGLYVSDVIVNEVREPLGLPPVRYTPVVGVPLKAVVQPGTRPELLAKD